MAEVRSSSVRRSRPSLASTPPHLEPRPSRTARGAVRAPDSIVLRPEPSASLRAYPFRPAIPWGGVAGVLGCEEKATAGPSGLPEGHGTSLGSRCALRAGCRILMRPRAPEHGGSASQPIWRFSRRGAPVVTEGCCVSHSLPRRRRSPRRLRCGTPTGVSPSDSPSGRRPTSRSASRWASAGFPRDLRC